MNKRKYDGLTFEMFLFRTYHLFCSSFAYSFSKTLAGDAMSRCQQSIVDCLSRHSVVTSVTLELFEAYVFSNPILALYYHN